MMNTLNYFVEANLCLAAFYVLFRLFLYHETGATFNRAFLLGALLLSVVVPLLHFGKLDNIPAVGKAIPAYLLPEITIGVGTAAQPETASGSGIDVWNGIAYAYVIVMALLFIRLIYRCMKLRSVLRNARLLAEANGVRILALDDPDMTFSVFRNIVVGNPSALSERERNLIISHESVHVRNGHTWDILGAELLCIMFWFNPAAWAMRSQLRDVHEFEADQKAAEGHDVQEYCSLLARIALQSQGFALAAHFSRSLTLKRIHMIKFAKNKISRWKIAALVPIVAGVLGFVACQDQVMSDINTVAENSSVALDVPLQVKQRYDELAGANPKAKYVILELQKEGHEKLEELSKQYGLPNTVEIFESRRGEFDNAAVYQKTKAAMILHEMEDKRYESRVFAILEYTDQVAAISKSTVREGEVYLIVEETAHPRGGMETFYSFLAENISYPAEAREEGITGRVFVEFVVEKDGTLTNFRVLKGIGHGCDDEAIRALAISPLWEPGTVKGQPVRQKMVMPIVFNL